MFCNSVVMTSSVAPRGPFRTHLVSALHCCCGRPLLSVTPEPVSLPITVFPSSLSALTPFSFFLSHCLSACFSSNSHHLNEINIPALFSFLALFAKSMTCFCPLLSCLLRVGESIYNLNLQGFWYNLFLVILAVQK